MKNFKTLFRIFALLVVLAITVTTAFAKATYETSADRDYSSAVDTLTGIGVLDGLDFAISENSKMTRADFIALVMHLYCGGKHTEFASDVKFADIPDGAAYLWAVRGAYEAGFINGRADGSFMPNDSVSYSEAVKIIISALGYGAKAQANGGYPTGYLTVAAGLGLDDIAFADANALTMGETVKLILDALNTEVLDVDSIGTKSVKYKARKNETWLSKAFDILKCEGVVDGNSLTGLYGAGTSLRKNQLRIDGKAYDATANFDSLIGMNVVYYLHGDDEIVYAYADGNTTLTLQADDIASLSDRTIKYYDGGRERQIAVSKGISVIYNGVCLADYDMDTFDISDGRVEFISNEGTTTYNVAKIYEYKNAFITAIDSEGESVTDLLGKEVINYGKIEHLTVYDGENKEISASEIPLKSAVSMFTSKDGDVAVWYVSDEVIDGFIEETSERGGKTFIVVGAREIEVSENCNYSVNTDSLGQKIFGYTDICGKLIYADVTGYSDTKYAYLVSVYAASGIKGELNFMLYDKDGQVKTLKSAAKLFINGSKAANLTAVPQELIKPTAIVYGCDEYGDVSTIYTPDAYGSPLVTICGEGTKMFYPGGGNYVFADENTTAYSGSFCIDENTVMLSIPSNAVSADEKYFSVLSPTSFAIFDTYNVCAYTQNNSSNIAEFVVNVNTSGDKLTLNREAAIVADKRFSTNDDGDTVYSLTLCSKNVKNKTYITADRDIAQNVEIGDMIVYSLNRRNEINNIAIVIDREKANSDGSVTEFSVDSRVTFNGKWYATFGLYRGYVYSNKNGTVCFAKTGQNPTGITRSDMLSFKTKNLTIIEVDTNADRRSEKVKYLNENSVSSYLDNGAESDVWLYVKAGTPMYMLIYK